MKTNVCPSILLFYLYFSTFALAQNQNDDGKFDPFSLPLPGKDVQQSEPTGIDCSKYPFSIPGSVTLEELPYFLAAQQSVWERFMSKLGNLFTLPLPASNYSSINTLHGDVKTYESNVADISYKTDVNNLLAEIESGFEKQHSKLPVQKKRVCKIIDGKKEYATFEGKLKDGKPHGYGRLIYDNGDWFKGAYNNGDRCGKGISFFAASKKKVIREYRNCE